MPLWLAQFSDECLNYELGGEGLGSWSHASGSSTSLQWQTSQRSSLDSIEIERGEFDLCCTIAVGLVMIPNEVSHIENSM